MENRPAGVRSIRLWTTSCSKKHALMSFTSVHLVQRHLNACSVMTRKPFEQTNSRLSAAKTTCSALIKSTTSWPMQMVRLTQSQQTSVPLPSQTHASTVWMLAMNFAFAADNLTSPMVRSARISSKTWPLNRRPLTSSNQMMVTHLFLTWMSISPHLSLYRHQRKLCRTFSKCSTWWPRMRTDWPSITMMQWILSRWQFTWDPAPTSSTRAIASPLKVNPRVMNLTVVPSLLLSTRL